MRKLKLDLEAIEVESFEIGAAETRRGGTVRGAQPEKQVTAGSDDLFCISNVPCIPTDYVSCIGTCPATCGDGFTCALPCQQA